MPTGTSGRQPRPGGSPWPLGTLAVLALPTSFAGRSLTLSGALASPPRAPQIQSWVAHMASAGVPGTCSRGTSASAVHLGTFALRLGGRALHLCLGERAAVPPTTRRAPICLRVCSLPACRRLMLCRALAGLSALCLQSHHVLDELQSWRHRRHQGTCGGAHLVAAAWPVATALCAMAWHGGGTHPALMAGSRARFATLPT